MHLFVYPPFASPVSPPYSLTALHAKFGGNILDLNNHFHNLKFKEYKEFFQKNIPLETYTKTAATYNKLARDCYGKNNFEIYHNNTPELFEELLNEILKKKPTIVAFSLVYSSQIFYASCLIKELKKRNILTIIGGPSAKGKITKQVDHTLKTNDELTKWLTPINAPLDYTIWNKNDYFTSELVLPIKTSHSCYYKKCTFCNHHGNDPYQEFDLKNIKESIKKSNANHFFLIDDMISVKRLSEIGDLFLELKKENASITWTAQLKPENISKELLQKLASSGLKMIMWGVESASQNVLDKIKKGTTVEEIKLILKNAKETGITNVLYILFGFPSETKEDFLTTVKFIQENKENIDLVSDTRFGLQKGTDVYTNPQKYGITKIIEEERTLLEPEISYEISPPYLNKQDLRVLLRRNDKKIHSSDKFPNTMNFFREHMLVRLSKKEF